MQSAIEKETVQLRWTERDRAVVVTPEDQDRYVTTVDRTIEALRIFNDKDAFDRKFKALQQRLAEWLRDNRNLIDRAFLTLRDSRLLFVVVQKGRAYDSDFEDSLTELDLEIANTADFDQMPLSVLALPACSDTTLGSFLDPETGIVFTHGE